MSLSMERLLLLPSWRRSVLGLWLPLASAEATRAFLWENVVYTACACTCVSVCAALPVEIRVLEEIAWLSPRWVSGVVGPGWDAQGSGLTISGLLERRRHGDVWEVHCLQVTLQRTATQNRTWACDGVLGQDVPPRWKVIASLETAAALDAVPKKLIRMLFRDLVILKKKERTQAPNNNQQLTNLFF